VELHRRARTSRHADIYLNYFFASPKRTNTEPPAECRATRPDAGKSPSVASLYRALAEVEQAAAADGLPIRPKPVRIRRPDDPLTPEEMNLRERLQAQVLQRSEDE
jgi:hypothetical protein